MQPTTSHLEHTSDTGDGFTTGQISNVDEGVVEGGEDVSNTKDELTLTDLGAQGHSFRLLLGSGTLGLYQHL